MNLSLQFHWHPPVTQHSTASLPVSPCCTHSLCKFYCHILGLLTYSFVLERITSRRCRTLRCLSVLRNWNDTQTQSTIHCCLIYGKICLSQIPTTITNKNKKAYLTPNGAYCRNYQLKINTKKRHVKHVYLNIFLALTMWQKYLFWTVWKCRITFMSGMVEPPRTTMVNRTMMSVVVTITCRCSLSNSRCRLRAKAIAPRKPAEA